MSKALGLLIVLIILFPCSYLVGLLVNYRRQASLRVVVKTYLLGFVATQGLFWVLCLPLTLLRQSLTLLIYIYGACMTVLCIGGAVVLVKDISLRWTPERLVLAAKQNLLEAWDFCIHQVQGRLRVAYILIFLMLFGYQMYNTITLWANGNTYDDYAYVVYITDKVSSDELVYHSQLDGSTIDGPSAKRDLNSWETYQAFLVRITGINVPIMAHTVMAVCLLFIAYLVYFYISRLLFKDKNQAWIFMVLVAAFHIWGEYSLYSNSFRLNECLWQGKAVVTVIVVPLLIGQLLEMDKRGARGRDALALEAITAAACTYTMMGCAFVCITLALAFIVYTIKARRLWNLPYMVAAGVLPVLQLGLYLAIKGGLWSW